jgi:UDP-hydrolysing UDP-N-acetyl-D-glucosamine 2-epimerase
MKPDCIVLLGDRLEALAMSISAVILQVPIAHIYGGDVTVGAMDDSVRHAITQLSTLHFPANEISFNRLLAMGVAVENTFNYGSPLLDTLESLDSLSPEELTRRFGINFGRITAMLTFHPAAYEIMAPLQILEVLFEALESMGNLNVIITGTNSDIGSRAVREAIAGFVVKNQGRVTYVESMGHQAYLSALKHVDVVIGNSSSIVLEAPLLGTPSILLGNRQDGRPLVDSVLTPEVTPASIREAIEKSLDREFIGNLGKIKSTFGIAGFAKKTAAKLASHIFERANQ